MSGAIETQPTALLGIECGATRSTVLLCQGDDLPCIRAEFGPANVRLMDDHQLVQHFTRVRTIQTDSMPPLAGIVVGIAGARNESDRERVREAAAKVWPKVPCYATNDLEPALVAAENINADKYQARVLILSGTGSCCFGRTRTGKTARLGGWGHIIGDKGSGYEIGLRALKAIVFYLDCEGELGMLGRSVLETLLLNQPDDLIDWCKTASKPDIARIAVKVFDAAAKGDKISKDILDSAAASLANDGVNCAKKLVKANAPVEFVFAGSVLLKQPKFAGQVRANLMKLWPKAFVTPSKRESIWGTIELAQEQFGKGTQVISRHHVPIVVHKSEVDTSILPVSTTLSPTEQRNPRSLHLDKLPLRKAIELMIEEDSKIPTALKKESKKIEQAVELIVDSFQRGGRLLYAGAGTSGRLGVLDASECPPTFRVPPDKVQGIIAGGQTALWRSVEGAEDDVIAGVEAIHNRGVNKRDTVVGIATSGRTPFVWGALNAAKKRGAKTVFLCFNPHLDIPAASMPDVLIAPDVGPEVLTGSTRLKAGTATKLVLNMFTTLSMVRIGKVISNLMVDMNASNKKLRERAVRIVQAITGKDSNAAIGALEKSRWIVKDACQRLR
jgi:N-acetylmuramic acid 6-phosphate etherase